MADLGYQVTLNFYNAETGKVWREKSGETVKDFVRTFNKFKDTSMDFRLVNPDSETEVKYEDNYGSLNLARLDYHKQLYKSNCINLTLEFSTGEDLKSKMVQISSLFCGAKVMLEVVSIEEIQQGEGVEYKVTPTGNVIAKDYVVYSACPKFDSSKGKKLYLDLTVFSPDKALDTIEYSKAYTGKKLGAEILNNELKNLMPSDPVKTKLEMSFLEDENGTYKEIIQPYLVQYNETFHAFLSRVANRCGEFLFYEDDKLNLGLHRVPIDINEDYLSEDIFDKISFSTNKTADSALSSESFCYNYMNTGAQAPSSSFVRNSELSGEEYMESVTKDKFASASDEREYRGHEWPALVGTVFTNTIGAGLVAGIGTMGLDLIRTAKTNAGAINETFNKKYFPSGSPDTKTLYSSADVTMPLGSGANVTSRFYANIEKLESEVSGNMVSLQINSGLDREFRLGQFLCLFDAYYTVVDIQAEYEFIEDRTTGGTKVNRAIRILAAPEVIAGGSMVGAPPVPVPPALVQHIRKSDPQLARVADIEDPSGLGRVQVRFYWQKETDDASPWIRVASQMANSNGGTSYFKAAVGDNVLIAFDNGNVDLPYVSGFLPKKNQQKNKGQYLSRRNSVVISSENGQMMLMKDDPAFATGNGKGVLGHDLMGTALAAIPYGIASIPGLGPALGIPKTLGENQKRFLGSTEFTDYYGIYSVKMSSSDKSITINSPFGKVDMNAFTGININAPNGDVKISGFNVSISAQNNISIESGTAIYDLTGKVWLANTVAQGVANFLLGTVVAKFAVDLEYLRHIFDMAIGPVEGTLSLKSGRYLLLQAGGADSIIPKRGFMIPKQNDALDRQDEKAAAASLLRVLSIIDGLVNAVTFDFIKELEVVNACVKSWEKNFFDKDNRVLLKKANDADFSLNDILGKVNSNVDSDFDWIDFHLSESYSQAINAEKRWAVKAALVEKVNDIKNKLRAVVHDYKFIVEEDGAGRLKMKWEADDGRFDKLYGRFVAAGAAEPFVGENALLDLVKTTLKSVMRGGDAAGLSYNVGIGATQSNKLEIKRYLAAKVLLSAAKKDSYKQPLNLTAPVGDALPESYVKHTFEEEPWEKWIRAMWAGSQNSTDFVKEAVVNAFKSVLDKINPIQQFTGSASQGFRVWGQENRGQILMSDVEGQTIYFNNGQLKTFNNSTSESVRHFCLRRLR